MKDLCEIERQLADARRRVAVLKTTVTVQRRAGAELVAQQERLLRELGQQRQERQLVAYDIHDGLAQQIAGALYYFQARADRSQTDPSPTSPSDFSAGMKTARTGDRITIKVEDGGRGFEPTKLAARCAGIEGIHERAQLLGGRAMITSSPGNGTSINVEIPLFPCEDRCEVTS